MSKESVVRESDLKSACKNADWVQVHLNHSYGPPCFHLEGERFCLRAKAWAGHDSDHGFVSLFDRITDSAERDAYAAQVEDLKARRDSAHQDAMIGHRWFERIFGSIMNGRDFELKAPMADRFLAERDQSVRRKALEDAAEIVADSMRHYEDESCTGTMRVALNCISKRIMDEASA